jgi:hypothetical protein
MNRKIRVESLEESFLIDVFHTLPGPIFSGHLTFSTADWGVQNDLLAIMASEKGTDIAFAISLKLENGRLYSGQLPLANIARLAKGRLPSSYEFPLPAYRDLDKLTGEGGVFQNLIRSGYRFVNGNVVYGHEVKISTKSDKHMRPLSSIELCVDGTPALRKWTNNLARKYQK